MVSSEFALPFSSVCVLLCEYTAMGMHRMHHETELKKSGLDESSRCNITRREVALVVVEDGQVEVRLLAFWNFSLSIYPPVYNTMGYNHSHGVWRNFDVPGSSRCTCAVASKRTQI